jgi:hypothetical protein
MLPLKAAFFILSLMNIEFNRNEDTMKLLVSAMNRKLEKIHLGGGAKRIEKLHAEGKMTARERIDYLVDKGSRTIEIGAFAGEGMYEEHGGFRSHVHHCCQRCYRKGRCMVSYHRKKEFKGTGDCDGEPSTNHLPCG